MVQRAELEAAKLRSWLAEELAARNLLELELGDRSATEADRTAPLPDAAQIEVVRAGLTRVSREHDAYVSTLLA